MKLNIKSRILTNKFFFHFLPSRRWSLRSCQLPLNGKPAVSIKLLAYFPQGWSQLKHIDKILCNQYAVNWKFRSPEPIDHVRRPSTHERWTWMWVSLLSKIVNTNMTKIWMVEKSLNNYFTNSGQSDACPSLWRLRRQYQVSLVEFNQLNINYYQTETQLRTIPFWDGPRAAHHPHSCCNWSLPASLANADVRASVHPALKLASAARHLIGRS